MRRANRAAWESWVLGYNFDPFAIRGERFLAPDAAWRAATGDAPSWSYPPAVERRK